MQKISTMRRAPPGSVYDFCFSTRIVASASIRACASSWSSVLTRESNLSFKTVWISGSFRWSKIACRNGACHSGYFHSICIR